MKLNRFINVFCLFIISMIVSISNVFAVDGIIGGILSNGTFPSSLKITDRTEHVTLDSYLNVTKNISLGNAEYAYFPIKNSEEGNVICTSGPDVAIPTKDTTCTSSSFSQEAQAKGVAYIINLIAQTNGSSDDKYWWTEFLVNSYLGNYNYGEESNTYKNIINSNNTILNTGKSYKQILEAAKEYEKLEVKNITLSADLSTVTFTKNEDGYYYSNPVTITSNGNFEIKLDNDKFTYDKIESGYVFKIKATDILPGSNQSFTATIASTESNSSYYVAQNYSCGANVQNISLLKTKEVKSTIPNPVTITGAVGKDATITKISKVSATDGKELPGATLEVQDEKGNIVKYCKAQDGTENSECKWVSTDKPYEIVGLPVGKYYLVETIAPEGYELSKEKVMFEVKGDGTVTEVKMENQIEVKVPDTLSGKSSLLLAIAMFDIALGIGIITYVKKNKIEE